jgi:hypothetical protein
VSGDFVLGAAALLRQLTAQQVTLGHQMTMLSQVQAENIRLQHLVIERVLAAGDLRVQT